MYRYLLFDLDGTLTDPGVGITNSVMYALSKFGITVTDRRELYPFIGPPLLDSFRDFYGLDGERGQQALAYYRAYFRPHGIYENEVYPGIPETLAALRARGKTLILATAKPEEFAREILRHFDLARYFDLIFGATMDERRNRKTDVIAEALGAAGITDRSAALMIGDRAQDVDGARENGIAALGVLYGYGDRAELSAARYLAETPADILCFV